MQALAGDPYKGPCSELPTWRFPNTEYADYKRSEALSSRAPMRGIPRGVSAAAQGIACRSGAGALRVGLSRRGTPTLIEIIHTMAGKLDELPVR